MLNQHSYFCIIECMSIFIHTGRPVYKNTIVVDSESIQIGDLYFKSIDLQFDLRFGTREYVETYLQIDHINIIESYFKYYANHR